MCSRGKAMDKMNKFDNYKASDDASQGDSVEAQNKAETTKPRSSTGVFLIQCLLSSPETTAIKHLLPPARLDNNIEGEITSVHFW